MSELTKIDEEQIKEAIAARYHVYPARDVCLYHDYEFVRRGNDKVRREFFYGLIDERCRKPLTNYDRIISKSPEELAEYLANVAYDLWAMFDADPRKMWLDWLKQEENKNDG